MMPIASHPMRHSHETGARAAPSIRQGDATRAPRFWRIPTSAAHSGSSGCEQSLPPTKGGQSQRPSSALQTPPFSTHPIEHERGNLSTGSDRDASARARGTTAGSCLSECVCTVRRALATIGARLGSAAWSAPARWGSVRARRRSRRHARRALSAPRDTSSSSSKPADWPIGVLAGERRSSRDRGCCCCILPEIQRRSAQSTRSTRPSRPDSIEKSDAGGGRGKSRGASRWKRGRGGQPRARGATEGFLAYWAWGLASVTVLRAQHGYVWPVDYCSSGPVDLDPPPGAIKHQAESPVPVPSTC
eukprot:scaffold33573_cov33-Tisochrysis_lutea.AAC.1